jgi:hypothetical protein
MAVTEDVVVHFYLEDDCPITGLFIPVERYPSLPEAMAKVKKMYGRRVRIVKHTTEVLWSWTQERV